MNELGQAIGDDLPGWTARPRPDARLLTGSYVQLERLDPARHAEALFDADRRDTSGASWTYLPYGPFDDRDTYVAWLEQAAAEDDPYFFAVVDIDEASPSSGRAVGVLSLLRIAPRDGSIEVGHVHYSPALQRRRGATESQYLLMAYAFDELGYRRYEWKCDALNAGSRRAAERLGFQPEGIFRQATVVKGRNRDTAWYSIIDSEWPAVRADLQEWLAPDNFDDQGSQKSRLLIAR